MTLNHIVSRLFTLLLAVVMVGVFTFDAEARRQGGVAAASRWVTLLDWRPLEFPPPMRHAPATTVKTPSLTPASRSVKTRETKVVKCRHA